MLYITVPDMNDSMSAVTIDNTEFNIRFTYNELGDYWSFGIYDTEEEPMIAMTKIVPDFPLTHFYTSTDLPDGTFGAISNELHIGRQTFNEGKAEFVYIPNSEVEE
ncbi:MAG: hypothetical protein RR275_05270 [Lachnospiraceae bacterium]